MENTVFESIGDVDDISTLDEYQNALEAGLSPEEALSAVAPFSRDNARTPMQWTDGPFAGFTDGTPWLKVNPNYTRINAASQISDADSVFSYYKKLIALRKNPDYLESLVYGDLVPYLAEQKNLMAFYRKGSDRTLLVLCNYQKEPQSVKLPDRPYRILLNNLPELDAKNGTARLDSYQAVILELN